MKRYIKSSEETRYNMTIPEIISFLEDIKYDLKPEDDYTLASENELIVYLFWGGNFINLGYYPIVQIDLGDRTIFHREGSENPGSWYKVVDEAINKISAENMN